MKNKRSSLIIIAAVAAGIVIAVLLNFYTYFKERGTSPEQAANNLAKVLNIFRPFKPEIEVPADLEVERNEQKSVDEGHSPWKLDPAFVAQVFVSLKISPGGIVGEYPIKEKDLKITYNTGTEAIVQVSGDSTPIRNVYLKRLVRQDPTGIWTVVGYDPISRN